MAANCVTEQESCSPGDQQVSTCLEEKNK